MRRGIGGWGVVVWRFRGAMVFQLTSCLEHVVYEFVVKNHLHTVTVDDDKVDACFTSVIKDPCEPFKETRLVEYPEVFLDITVPGHGNNAIIADLETAVFLVDRTEHVLYYDNRSWTRDEG